ncbi:MAG: cytochrome P450 [Dongiaceae bacterium]
MAIAQTDVVSATLPGRSVAPRPLSSLGALFRIWRDPIGFFSETALRYGAVARFSIAGRDVIVVADPDVARQVLHQNAARYRKNFGALRDLIGQGVLTAEGALWRRLRELEQPVFRPSRMPDSAPSIVAAADATIADWAEAARSNRRIGIEPAIGRATLAVIVEFLLGSRLGGRAEAVRRDMEVVLAHAGRRAFALTALSGRLPTPENLACRRALARLDVFCAGLVAERRANPGNHDDLLSQLIDACDSPAWPEIDARQVRNEIMTYLFAGQETTATLLVWALHLLARNPACQARLKGEYERALAAGLVSPLAMDRVPMAEAVMQEAMRLYAPAWAISRTALAEDAIGGVAVRKGSIVVVCVQAMHRRPELWDEPESFRPERFDRQAAGRARHPFQYIPFGAGPRTCVGSRLAMLEAPYMVARLVQAYRFAPADAKPVALRSTITLRPRDPLRLEIGSW